MKHRHVWVAYWSTSQNTDMLCKRTQGARNSALMELLQRSSSRSSLWSCEAAVVRVNGAHPTRFINRWSVFRSQFFSPFLIPLRLLDMRMLFTGRNQAARKLANFQVTTPAIVRRRHARYSWEFQSLEVSIMNAPELDFFMRTSLASRYP